MDKAAIRAKADELVEVMHNHLEDKEDIAVLIPALTQAHEQGDKEGYKRGWYECKEAAALKVPHEDPICDWEDGDRQIVRDVIRRLRIEDEE